MGIDPSLGSLGLAILEGSRPVFASTLKQATLSTNYHQRAMLMAHEVATILDRYAYPATTMIVMEVPANWFDARGQASKDSEAVQKLYTFVGCMLSVIDVRCLCSRMWIVRPRAWKGTLPKPVIAQRVQAWMLKYNPTVQYKSGHYDTDEAVMLAIEARRRGLHSMPINEYTEEVNGFHLVQPLPVRDSFTEVSSLPPQ